MNGPPFATQPALSVLHSTGRARLRHWCCEFDEGLDDVKGTGSAIYAVPMPESPLPSPSAAMAPADSIPGPDASPVSASGFANGRVRVATDARPGDDGEVRLFWILADPEQGPGVPLLLVNGLGSPLVAYEAGFVTELLNRGFSVLRFDNRDVGRSGRIVEEPVCKAPPYTLADLAADAVAVLDAAGWASAHVLGQSMGGMIVQQMAINHPHRLRSLTSLMSTTGERGYGQPTDEAYPALIKPAPRDRAGWLDNRVETEKIWASPGSWDVDAARAKGELLYDYGIDVDGTGRQFRAIMASGSRDEALADVTVPTLVVHGDADTLIQPDGGRHTADVIPGARYLEIEGFGHDLPREFWPLLADIVAEFVEASPKESPRPPKELS